jgi:predicted Zn-ribbon and HTH transcriptional regulator
VARARRERSGEAEETLRRRLLRWLGEAERDFESLRIALALSPRELDDELRHVERSLRRRGGRLRVKPPECRDCGYAFPGRSARHFHPPGRCPECRGQRITPPRLRIEAGRSGAPAGPEPGPSARGEPADEDQ